MTFSLPKLIIDYLINDVRRLQTLRVFSGIVFLPPLRRKMRNGNRQRVVSMEYERSQNHRHGVSSHTTDLLLSPSKITIYDFCCNELSVPCSSLERTVLPHKSRLRYRGSTLTTSSLPYTF